MAKRADIEAKLSLDSSGFKNTLKKSQHNVKSFVSGAVKSFGLLAGAAGFGALTKSAIDLGSKISDLAVQLNIGTTELQVLEFASREAGVAIEITARALRNVQTRTEEAIDGNKSYAKAFEKLNINLKEFRALSTEKKLEAIAIAQNKATDKAAAYNAVARILGEKAGPALQEVLQNLAGPEGYGGLEAAAKRANEVMGPETVAKMDEAADAIEAFKRKIVVATAEILNAMLTIEDKTRSVGRSVGNFAARVAVSLKTGQNAFAMTIEKTEELEGATNGASSAQMSLVDATDMATQFLFDEADALETLAEKLDKTAKKEEELARQKFINAKELEALQLRAAGKNAEAEALERQIKLTKEAMEVSKKYGISLAKAAGIVKGIDDNLPDDMGNGGSGGGGGGTPASTKTFDKADSNKSGITTGREKRAQEAVERKAAAEARRARAKEMGRESGASERARTAGRDSRMTSREEASGLFLAGNDPMSGRRPGGMTADQAKGAAGEKDGEIVKVKDEMIKVNETLNNLAGALSGD